MPVFNNILAGASGQTSEAAAFQIDRSLRFNSADSAYLSRTPSSAGNRTTWTWSGWVKRSKPGSGNYLFMCQVDSSNYSEIYFDTDDKIKINNRVSGSDVSKLITDAVYRDVSAWYHIVVVSNSSTSLKLYVNGVEVDDFSTSTGPTTDNWSFNSTSAHGIGANNTGTGYHLDGYLAEVYFIDGQALAATDFGEYDDNNNWNPKAFSGTYGTNGYKLDFSDNTSTTTVAEDSSGNNNDWTANNLSVASGATNDSLLDSPTNYDDGTNVGGNYCTWNPNDMEEGVITLSEGNLKTVTTSATGDNVRGTLGFSSGKWYWECTITNFSGGFDIGFATPEWNLTAGDVGNVANSWSVSDAGTKKAEGSTTSSATDAFNSTGKVIGIAFDADAGSVKYFIDGTDQGVIFSGLDTSYTYMPAIYLRVDTTGGIWNFGQRPYTYSAPTGYKGLCTQNLDDPTIADGSDYMDAVLYEGNGGTKSVSDLDFEPGLVWIKNRDQNDSNKLVDQVRGETKEISSNSNGVEVANADGLTSFDTNGFTLGDDLEYNTDLENYVAWAWNAGTGSPVSNTNGSITSSVLANQDAGFSIVTYSGGSSPATVGHGLGAKPYFIAVKRLNTTTSNWAVYHEATSATHFLRLNTTINATDNAAYWNDTEPTSSVFTINSNSTVNDSGGNYVAYCWAPVEGYSAFGSYTGNGDPYGPFVYTGFRPRWILLKESSVSGNNWNIYDTSRNKYNVVDAQLKASNTGNEVTNTFADFLSNGFKIRSGTSGLNTDTQTFVYAAFAENPFKTSRAR
jgi:hypothetical protein